MQLISFTSAQAFLDVAEPILEKDEARNALILGIVGRLAADPTLFEDPAYLAVVFDGEQQVLHAMMTPPFGIVLAGDENTPAAALHLLCDDLRAKQLPLPDVNAPKPLSERFAALWTANGGQRHQLVIASRLYRLEKVAPARPTPGQLRLATAADIPLIMQWLQGFDQDTFHRFTHMLAETQKVVAQRVAHQDWFIWQNQGVPVSMCLRSRPTKQTIAITFVYTPPEARGQGYASAMNAAVAQYLLDQGYRYCTLYTDLTNPTSNRIYQQVGYQPWVDFDKYKFV